MQFEMFSCAVVTTNKYRKLENISETTVNIKTLPQVVGVRAFSNSLVRVPRCSWDVEEQMEWHTWQKSTEKYSL